MRLKKYKKKHADPLECSVTTKLTKKDYKLFREYLKGLNLTEAEGMRYLIQEELASLVNDALVDPPPTPPKTEPRKRKKNVVFSSKKWQVGNRLPCIFCESWHLAKNMSRHLKRHGYDSVESYLTDNAKKAMQMKTSSD